MEALPAAVRLALVGRASRRASVISTWPRSEIIAIDVGVYGVRLRLRGKRRARWIAVGTQSQSRRICQLLREELNLRPS